MLAIILFLISFPLVLWLIYFYYRVNYFEKYLKTIPGPVRYPLLGNALEFTSPVRTLPTLMKYYQHFKCNYKIYIGSQPYFVICEPKDIESLLNSTKIISKADFYKYLHNWLGTGLLTSTGDKWRKHRKIITPAFHFQILDDFIDVFTSNGDILVSKLRTTSKILGVFDVYPFITRCTLDIICEAVMGTAVNAQDDLDSEYVKSVNTLLRIAAERTTSVLLSNDFVYCFTKTYREERAALKLVHGYTKSVINKRKATFFGDQRNMEEAVDPLGRRKKRAFLDSLLEYSLKDPSLTEDDICQEVDTFMFEGHDTVATSISFALYTLSTHADVQEKACAELQRIFCDDPRRSATFKDLQEMKYLEMVIKESLRIYATVPVYGRTLEQDMQWDGLVLPKELMLTIFSYGVHNSEVHENPEVFDPERFSVENSQGRHPFSYIPFSAGPRNCIGQKFAMLEMKATISSVLRNFELLPTVPKHEIVLRSEGVLKSDSGVFMQLKEKIILDK